MADISGGHLGEYYIKRRLGQGGMGAVYLAYQATMDRDVAIKVLPAALGLDPEFATRFRREARVIANLQHARILPVHDYGEEDGLAFLVMRFLDGRTLRERIVENAPLSPRETLRVVTQVAEGLAFAHTQGIIHRDLTSNNIMFDSAGDAYITDFGLSKMIGNSASLTGSAIVGTPEYIAPEVGLGNEADQRSDIYSLGVVLFEMLTGRTPYTGASAMVVIVKHINEQIPDPTEINPALPASISAVVLKATAKDPDDRFQSAQELARALNAAVRQGVAPASVPTRVGQKTAGGDLPRWVMPVGIGVIVVLLMTLAAGLAFTLSSKQAAQTTPAQTAVPATPTPEVELAVVTPTSEAGVPPTEAAPTIPASPGGPVGTLPARDAGVIECGSGRTAIIAHDFRSDRPEGLSLFAPAGQNSLSLNGDFLAISAMVQGQTLPLILPGPVGNPDVLVKALWPEGAGVLRIAINADRASRTDYGFMIDGPGRTIRFIQGPTPLVEKPLTASLFDGGAHEIRVTNFNGTLTATIDRQTVLQTDVNPAPAAGDIHFDVNVKSVEFDELGVCGTP